MNKGTKWNFSLLLEYMLYMLCTFGACLIPVKVYEV